MIKKLLLLVLVTVFTGVAGFYWLWQNAQQLSASPLQLSTNSVVFAVEKGRGARDVMQQLIAQKIVQDNSFNRWYFRLKPELTRVQAGHYRLEMGMNVRDAFERMVRGDIVQMDIAFIEGWRLSDWRKALAGAALLQQRLPGMSDKQLLQWLGDTRSSAEGLFFPASYRYTEKTSDLDVLRVAYQRMQEELHNAWQERQSDLPYRDEYEALVMASIVEKETGTPADREQIAGVFVRRLKKNMRLQTDPSVIYGLGDSFDGNLRKVDLLTDSPYNTYTRAGLPPTPIAMPGRAALLAALHPAPGDAIYFVARGDGSSVFSSTLEQHNAAVRRFQLRKNP